MAKRRELILTEEEKQELIGYRDHHDRPDVREKAAALERQSSLGYRLFLC